MEGQRTTIIFQCHLDVPSLCEPSLEQLHTEWALHIALDHATKGPRTKLGIKSLLRQPATCLGRQTYL